MTIQVQPVPSLKDLIGRARVSGVKRVLLTSYGSVEMVREDGAVILAGMTTVVATILDARNAKSPKICRWQEKGRSKGTVAIGAGQGLAGTGEPMARLRDDVRELLREEGFEVDEGEWTPESAARSLASRQRLIG